MVFCSSLQRLLASCVRASCSSRSSRNNHREILSCVCFPFLAFPNGNSQKEERGSREDLRIYSQQSLTTVCLDLGLKSHAFGLKQHWNTPSGGAARDEHHAVAVLYGLCTSLAPDCAPAEARSNWLKGIPHVSATVSPSLSQICQIG